MSKFLSGIADRIPMVSRFLTNAAVKAHLPRSLQRIVSRDPLHSKFIAFFVPDKLTLEYKGPDAATVQAEAKIHQAAATATTPALKPRFNRAGPRP